MTNLIDNIKRLLPVIMVAALPVVAVAQDYYYDDDIYYDASSKKKEQTKKQPQTSQKKNNSSGTYYNYSTGTRPTSDAPARVADYPAADTYTPGAGSSSVDVDTYNRRGQFLVPDSVVGEKEGGSDFAYTQRIERFHNPEIVSGSDDADLQDAYYYTTSQPQTNINVYVVDDPWYAWSPSWTWRYGNPWRWSVWGPS